MPPACEKGTISFTIRKPSLIEKSLNDLDKDGSFALVEEARKTIHPFEHELLKLMKEKRIKEFLSLAILKERKHFFKYAQVRFTQSEKTWPENPDTETI